MCLPGPNQVDNLHYPKAALPLSPSGPLLIPHLPPTHRHTRVITERLCGMSTNCPCGAQSTEFLWLICPLNLSLDDISDPLQPGSGIPPCSHKPLLPRSQHLALKIASSPPNKTVRAARESMAQAVGTGAGSQPAPSTVHGPVRGSLKFPI